MNPFKHLIPLIDLTTLNPEENEARIVKFCKNATTPFGRVASVCVDEKFVALARASLDEFHAEKVGVTTVFSTNDQPEAELLKRIDAALEAGANSIEVVYPYHAHLAGDEALGGQYLAGIRALCLTKGATFKVILECTKLESEAHIRKACQIAIQNGAHFIKSSSHRYKANENLDWLAIMLDEINLSGKEVGIKISGGCLDLEQAQKFIAVILEKQGNDWLSNQHIRIGCSSLLTEILNLLGAMAAEDSF